MATATTKPRRNRAAEKIIKKASETIFPLPAQPDPTEVEGLLTGVVMALEAVGYTLDEESP